MIASLQLNYMEGLGCFQHEQTSAKIYIFTLNGLHTTCSKSCVWWNAARRCMFIHTKLLKCDANLEVGQTGEVGIYH